MNYILSGGATRPVPSEHDPGLTYLHEANLSWEFIDLLKTLGLDESDRFTVSRVLHDTAALSMIAEDFHAPARDAIREEFDLGGDESSVIQALSESFYQTVIDITEA